MALYAARRCTGRPTVVLACRVLGVYDLTETAVEVLAIVTKAEAQAWLDEEGIPAVRRVALAKVKDDLSRYLKLAAQEEIVITRHGRPAGVLIGFASDEDWVEYRLEHHPEFPAASRRRERRYGRDRACGWRTCQITHATARCFRPPGRLESLG